MSTTAPQAVPAAAPAAADQQTKAMSSRQKPTRRGGWGTRIALAIACVLWTVPTIGLLITSFRSTEDAVSSGWWTTLVNPFGTDWTVTNFQDAIADNNMGTAFINSITVSIPATVIPIMFAAFAAYAFTFMQFRGKDLLFIIVVSLLVVPIQVAFVPMLRLFGNDGLDITGQFVAVWLLHTGFGMPLAIYILRNYMATLPKTIIESAEIDGASHFQTFWRLIVPMSVPALAAFAIFQFLWVWNDLLIALLFLGTENAVVTVQLQQLLGRLGEGWQLVAAGAFVTMVVPLLVFFSLQRYFVRGLTAGSVKG
jgi:alpha-glucoside transport system permease protein